ncbi:U6 snRNA-associated Sm-like protein LSm7 [Tupaia chinensis]|uniref:U6 snRNA-associated Sm-like protein LSm7 n=1 Tax=Tupaia chinensis TaxID=246437 RepID=UPI0003C90579|nr:U6 snRNA-associated Sm-like protein LSm7 [Tupaia chinensis]
MLTDRGTSPRPTQHRVRDGALSGVGARRSHLCIRGTHSAHPDLQTSICARSADSPAQGHRTGDGAAPDPSRARPRERAARPAAGPPASRAPLSPQDKEKKKKESILDLSKYIDKTIRVKFQGGREASGILKGFDPLLNLVLDGTIEYMRDPDDQYKLTEDTRQLGLVVCRGTSVVLICPQDGMEAIPNPFVQQQDA